MGLKCSEKIKGKDQYWVKHQKFFTIKLDSSAISETLHNVIRNHYKISAKRNTYLGDYKRQSVETTFTNAGSFAFRQKDKRSLQLYLYYPKTFSKLQVDVLIEENKKISSSSDDEGFNLDTRHVPPSWNGAINVAETSDQ